MSKSSSIVRTAGGRRQDAHARPRHDAERALAAHDHPAQVVAGRLGSLGADALERSVGHHDVEREHVGARDAVGQAVRAARVRVHVAADRRCLLARRVGGEREPERRAARSARSRFGTPGSTHASRSSGRTSRMRVICAVTTTSASPIGVAAPASPVPLPRGHDRQAVLGGRSHARLDLARRSSGTRRARSRLRPSRRRARTGAVPADRRAPRRGRARPPARGGRRRRRP